MAFLIGWKLDLGRTFKYAEEFEYQASTRYAGRGCRSGGRESARRDGDFHLPACRGVRRFCKLWPDDEQLGNNPTNGHLLSPGEVAGSRVTQHG